MKMRNKRFIKHTSKAFAILMSAMMAVGIAMPVSAAEKKETKVRNCLCECECRRKCRQNYCK